MKDASFTDTHGTAVTIPTDKLAGLTNALAALLDVLNLLPVDHQAQALATCATMAGDINLKLLALTQGGAK